MSVLLYPRLSSSGVRTIFEGLDGSMDASAGANRLADMPEAVRFAASGGRRAGDAEFAEIRQAIVDIASRHGFPERRAETAHAGIRARARFDAEAAVWLGTSSLLDTPEALRDDVWAFFTSVLLPDVVVWRFGIRLDRFDGGIRNTFQRLWVRARVLDRGADSEDRWGLLDALTEDAFVSITDRSSIAADARLARALAEGWVRARDRIRPGNMEDLMRAAAIGVRLLNEIRMLSVLGDAELAEAIDAEFDRAAQAIAARKAEAETAAAARPVASGRSTEETAPRHDEDDRKEPATVSRRRRRPGLMDRILGRASP